MIKAGLMLAWGLCLSDGAVAAKAPKRSPGARFDRILAAAENRASPEGKAVLHTGKQMIDRKETGRKGCWDYINRVYSRAGYPSRDRVVLFRNPKSGPYADLKQIQPGDWLYYVNHSYNNVEHSAIFVDWINRGKNEALMLSYAGENRKAVARYKIYDLSGVYRIIRPRAGRHLQSNQSSRKSKRSSQSKPSSSADVAAGS